MNTIHKEQINQDKNCLNNQNLNISNKNIFISQIINIPRNVDIKNDAEKLDDNVCPYCQWTFCSNFSMRRHRDNTHLNKNLMDCPICKRPFKDLKKHMKTCVLTKEINSKAIVKKNLLGNKHSLAENKEKNNNNDEDIKIHEIKIYDNAQTNIFENANSKNNIEISEKQNAEKVLEPKKNHDCFSEKNNNKYNNLVIENQQDSFSINSKNAAINENINDIIIKNFYDIINTHEYFSLNNYFILKYFVLGQGKYGTIWFGIDVKNANPVAIKAQNNTASYNSFDLEISVMNKLRKYKIFSILFNKFYLNDKIYLIETLHLPTIAKFKSFCKDKFSITTIYRIGIELLNCYKLMHKAGHLYIDLKADNVVVLSNEIKLNLNSQKLTLIDYGYCVQYTDIEGNHLEEKDSPKLHGNLYFASLNSLQHRPISRRDDIISLCYLLGDLCFGKLPWSDKNGKGLPKTKIIQLKQEYDANKLFGNDLKELLYIFNDARKLKFKEKPHYKKYIKILKGYIANQIKINQKYAFYDWENKLLYLSGKFDSAKEFAKNGEIKNLFDGYPAFYVENILQKYFK